MTILGDTYRLKVDFGGMKRDRLVEVAMECNNEVYLKYFATGEIIPVDKGYFEKYFTHCETRKFEVKEGTTVIAHLQYEPASEQYTLWLTQDSTLYPYCNQPGRVIDEFEAKAWIADRVIPPERLNIDGFLKNMGHANDPYKDIYFIECCQGRCRRDPYYIVEVKPQ